MRGRSSLLIRMLVVIGAVVASLAPSAMTTAQGTSVTVGNTTITWQGAWEYDAAASLEEQATFSQIDMGAAVIRLLSYGEFQDGTVANADQAIDVFAGAFFEGAGLAAVAPRDSGLLPDGSSWRVYDFDLQGTEVSFLISASVNAFGNFTITSLTANTEALADSIVMVQEDFLLNGSGRIFDGLDPAEATGSAFVPSVGVPSSAAQTLMVGGTQLTWEGDWSLETDEPIEDIVTFADEDPVTSAISFVVYGDFADIAFLGPEGVLDLLMGTLFESFEVTPRPPLASGDSVDGSIWRVYALEYDGLELQALAQARSDGDSVVLSTLFTTSDDLEGSIAIVQEDFTLNGTGRLFETAVIAEATGGSGGSSVLEPTATERPSVRADLTLPPQPAAQPTQVPAASSGGLEVLSITTRDAGIGDGSTYAYVEVINNSGELVSYVGLEGTCRDASGGILGTGIGNTANVLPGETVVITIIFLQVPGCTDVDVRFDALTGLL